MKNFLILLNVVLLSSCGNFIDRLHRQMDADSSGQNNNTNNQDQFSMYRGQNNPQGMRPNAPVHNMVSTNNNQLMAPPVQREYLPENEVRRRFTTSDLQDNSDGGSLWATPNNSSSLFANDEKKATGDILLINVQNRLKDEITMTLKKFYPPNESPQKKEGEKPAAQAPAPGQAKDPNSTEPEADDKYHDKISSVIVEEINKEHVLLRGRKSLMFHNRKRMVEIQAMASRRDIKMDNSVDSDNILESSIQVLR
jgi:flagellar L-ring protein FlgH